MDVFFGAEDRNRTGTKFNPRRILSPVRLPVPPLRQVLVYNSIMTKLCQVFFIYNLIIFEGVSLGATHISAFLPIRESALWEVASARSSVLLSLLR